jgi:hypothetical protein
MSSPPPPFSHHNVDVPVEVVIAIQMPSMYSNVVNIKCSIITAEYNILYIGYPFINIHKYWTYLVHVLNLIKQCIGMIVALILLMLIVI